MLIRRLFQVQLFDRRTMTPDTIVDSTRKIVGKLADEDEYGPFFFVEIENNPSNTCLQSRFHRWFCSMTWNVDLQATCRKACLCRVHYSYDGTGNCRLSAVNAFVYIFPCRKDTKRDSIRTESYWLQSDWTSVVITDSNITMEMV